MIKFDVKNGFCGSVQFTAEIDCDPSASESTKLGLAVKWALKKGVDLRWTDLRRADLRYVDLQYADLQCVNFRYADLRSADLRGAALWGADLRDADLRDADILDFCISLSELRYVDLRGARNAPLMLNGLSWFAAITKNHMQIGCEHHSIEDWENFDDRRILNMDGRGALKFWRAHKEMLLSLAKAHQKNFTQEDEKEAAA